MRVLPWTLIAVACTLALAGCKKKPAEAEHSAATSQAQPAPTPAATPAPQPPAEPTQEQRRAAEAKAKLDYATMEDGYINDPKAQWASGARASSAFNETPEKAKENPQASRAWNATGSPDGKQWMQLHQDIGMDWIELSYAQPVHATQVRAVLTSGDAVRSIAKVELIDEGGTAQAVWSGVSDMEPDKRGQRSWFVKSFPATANKIKAVKLTFANAVSSGYKEVDAVQLVGE
ncbi:hypothetical protein [Ideonella sp. YS5]|uniref:hypothetical protein n=1 Tax=Ideonella sp. YS5 TaxID=3453714 RepID=UPI003EEF61B1